MGMAEKEKPLLRESFWVYIKIKKGVRKRAFHSPWIKKEQNSHNPFVFYSVLTIRRYHLKNKKNDLLWTCLTFDFVLPMLFGKPIR